MHKITPELKQFTLSNQQKVIWVPSSPHDQRLYLGMFYQIGSRQEEAKHWGISHFLEHMLFRGSKKYPSFQKLAEAFELCGGEWNAATSYEHTEFSYSGLWNYHQQIIPLFVEFLSQPLFLDIDKEREIILREKDDELNEYDNSTDLNHHSLAMLSPNSSLSHPITGYEQTIHSIKQKDLINYWNRYYHQKNSILCVAGGDANDKLEELLENSFQSTQSTQKPTLDFVDPKGFQFDGPQCEMIEDHNNQYQIQLSFLCEPEGSDNDCCYFLLSYLLTDGFTSYLSHRLREEKGLVYDVSSSYQSFREKGVFSIQAQTHIKNTLDVLKETLYILNKLKKENIPTNDLKKATQRYCVDLELTKYDQEYLCYSLFKQQVLNHKQSLESLYENAQKITSHRIQNIANTIFVPKNTAICLLGPKNQDLKTKIKDLFSQQAILL